MVFRLLVASRQGCSDREILSDEVDDVYRGKPWMSKLLLPMLQQCRATATPSSASRMGIGGQGLALRRS